MCLLEDLIQEFTYLVEYMITTANQVDDWLMGKNNSDMSWYALPEMNEKVLNLNEKKYIVSKYMK